MQNIEEILQKLIAEHNFLKDMQQRIVGNHDIMIENQKRNADNHDLVIQNQTTIIKNQEIIVNNQVSIIRNQRQIADNQITLAVTLQTQTHLLNLVKKLSGQEESIEETERFIQALRNQTIENLNNPSLNDPQTL